MVIIRSDNSNLMVRLPDGSFHSINKMEIVNAKNVLGHYRELELENHENADFRSFVKQARIDFSSSSSSSNGNLQLPGWQLIDAKLVMKDGTTYEMDSLGRTTRMIDLTGLNEITFHYTTLGLLLSYIEDSMGRKIRFSYDLGFGSITYHIPRINRIWVEDDSDYNREIIYTLDRSHTTFGLNLAPL